MVRETWDKPFRLGKYSIDPATGKVEGDGRECKLEPKVITVLQCLAQQAGSVISREELEASAWQGVVVGYDSLASAIIKLRKAFNDDAKNPQYIETVPKKGYRLLLSPESCDGNTETSKSKLSANSRQYLLGAAVAMVFLLVGFGFSINQMDTEGESISNPASLAVLPFKNLSSDPRQEYFSDGITADLINDLSRLPELSVIAMSSVFAYKKTSMDVREIGKKLGVQYVIEGSVRKLQGNMRISAQLIDTRNGFTLWADRFEGKLQDVFDLQEQVGQGIVDSLKIKLSSNKQIALSRQYTQNIQAYDHYLQGWQQFWQLSKESNLEARTAYEKAVKADNKFARAYANLALTYGYEALNGWTENPREALSMAKQLADKAIGLNDQIPQVHWVKGLMETYNRDYQAAVASTERCIQINPSYADCHALMAVVLNYGANPSRAKKLLEKAMKLHPNHSYMYKMAYGEILFNLRQYVKASENFTIALERNPEAQEARLWLAATYAYMDKIEDAQWEIEHIRNQDPKVSLARYESVIPLKDPQLRKHLINGLKKAGLE